MARFIGLCNVNAGKRSQDEITKTRRIAPTVMAQLGPHPFIGQSHGISALWPFS